MKNCSSLTVALLLAVIGGCGDGGDGGADAAPAFDARPINRTDRAYVIKKMKLPRTTEDVDAASFLYPNGDYPVNKMGGLTTVMLDLVDELPIQDFVDDAVEDGTTLNTWIIRSGPLDEHDPAPVAFFGHMQDADDPPDPSNNLDGTGQLRLRNGGMLFDAITDGDLTDGLFEGHGTADTNWGYDLRLNDEFPPYNAPGVYGRIRVNMTETGFTGASASVISPEQLEAEVYPGIAEILTRGIRDGVAQAATIKVIYDANDDDVVTVQELIDSDQMASLASPDVDLDGDGVNEHISQGMTIEAVRVEIIE